MTSAPPVTFEILLSGRQFAKFGNILIGEIRPGKNGSSAGAFYKLHLKSDGEEQPQRPVETIAIARRNLLFRAAECFETSPYGATIAEAIRSQGEAERWAG
jgi:hypothetical protein